MPRPIFIPLEVDYADDKDIAKVARYSRPCEARALRDLLVQMWCYCKQELSDGQVPIEQVGKLAYPDTLKVALRDADRLVEIGVVERTDSGYYLPGFLKRNKSRAEVEAESAKKAEAGRIGGIRSGQIRKAEADMKHRASKGLNTEGRGQRTEDTVTTSVGGERTETLDDDRATFPTHCQDHRYVETPPPCGGCRAAREAIERAEKRTHLAVVGDCARCGGTGWIEAADGSPVRKCDHRRNA